VMTVRNGEKSLTGLESRGKAKHRLLKAGGVNGFLNGHCLLWEESACRLKIKGENKKEGGRRRASAGNIKGLGGRTSTCFGITNMGQPEVTLTRPGVTKGGFTKFRIWEGGVEY